MDFTTRLIDNQRYVECSTELVTQTYIANVKYRKEKKCDRRFTFTLYQPQAWRIVLS